MSVILGGGLSGLSAAYYLRKGGYKNKLIIIEAMKNCGGWIQSTQGKDYIFELGPRTIRPMAENGRNTLRLIEDLGLTDSVLPIPASQSSASNRMVYVKGELHVLPKSFTSLFKTNTPFSKPLISALYHDLVTAPATDLDDDSIYNFAKRRFGDEVADFAVSPLLCGICAGDAKELSVKFLMPSLFEREQKYGGVVKGTLKSLFGKKPPVIDDTSFLVNQSAADQWTAYSLKGGLNVLPETLLKSVVDEQCIFQPNTKATKINFYSMKNTMKASIKFDNGMEIGTKTLYSSLPAHELGNLIKHQHPILSQLLQEIPYVTVAVINLKYDTPNLIKKEGFGFLVPPAENLPILGVIFDSCCFPEQNRGTVLTAMLGGRWFEERCGSNPTESDLLNMAQTNIAKILGIDIKPEAYRVKILQNCIPQYLVGHYERVDKIKDYIKENKLPLSIIGASYDGIAINDVILSAKNAVECNLNEHSN